MYTKTDLIYVKSPKLGPIPPLRMNGPIFSPMKITVERAERCLATKIPLSQIDPITGIAVPLTMENLYDDTKLEAANKEAELERSGKGIFKSISPVSNYNDTHSSVLPLKDEIKEIESTVVEEAKEEEVRVEENTNTTTQNQYSSKKNKKR